MTEGTVRDDKLILIACNRCLFIHFLCHEINFALIWTIANPFFSKLRSNKANFDIPSQVDQKHFFITFRILLHTLDWIKIQKLQYSYVQWKITRIFISVSDCMSPFLYWYIGRRYNNWYATYHMQKNRHFNAPFTSYRVKTWTNIPFTALCHYTKIMDYKCIIFQILFFYYSSTFRKFGY